MYAPVTAATSGSFLHASAATNPDKTSPVPPSVRIFLQDYASIFLRRFLYVFFCSAYSEQYAKFSFVRGENRSFCQFPPSFNQFQSISVNHQSFCTLQNLCRKQCVSKPYPKKNAIHFFYSPKIRENNNFRNGSNCLNNLLVPFTGIEINQINESSCSENSKHWRAMIPSASAYNQQFSILAFVRIF